MLDRAIEEELLPYCIEQNISTLAYSPLEQGLLTGAIGMHRKLTPGEYKNNIPWFQPLKRQKVLTLLDGWKTLAEKYGCNLAQLVIAWTVEQPGITFALCGARKAEHSKQNAVGGTLILEGNHIEKMRTDVEALGAPL